MSAMAPALTITASQASTLCRGESCVVERSGTSFAAGFAGRTGPEPPVEAGPGAAPPGAAPEFEPVGAAVGASEPTAVEGAWEFGGVAGSPGGASVGGSSGTVLGGVGRLAGPPPGCAGLPAPWTSEGLS